MISIPVNGSVLIKGGMGSGKTVMLKSMITYFTPGTANVTLISPYVEDYKKLSDDGFFQSEAKTTEQAEQEIADAYQAFEEKWNGDNIGATDARPSYLFIDETQIILKEISHEAAEQLNKLVPLGHNVGIEVVAAGLYGLSHSAFVEQFHVIVDTEKGIIQYRDSPMLVQ